MTTVVGVRFRNTGKAYYYDPADLALKTGDKVIVETIHGTEIGRIALPPREVEESQIVKPLRKVTRLATEEDKKQEIINIEKEKEAYRVCREKIKERGLDMKLVKAEYAFDNKKVLFYFTADGRVDFRELVKDLAAAFRTRIELRQIGVRDETKTLGGIGICGRELCCTSYLNEFAPVSIRMAKEQNLSLNPAKISGVCGRLLCCLKNEQEAYEYLNRKMPKMGEEVITPDGADGEAVSMNILRQTVRVLTEEGDDKEITEFPVDELELTGHRRKKNSGNNNNDGSDKAREAGAKDKRPARERGRRNADSAKNAETVRNPEAARSAEGVKGAETAENADAGMTAENMPEAPVQGRSRTRSEMRREAQEARENRRSRMREDRASNGERSDRRERGNNGERGDRGERRNSARKNREGGDQPKSIGRDTTERPGQNNDPAKGGDPEKKREGRRRRHSRGRGRGRGNAGEGAGTKNEGNLE